MKSNPVRSCVPVCVRHSPELRAAMNRAAKAADMIELRLDCLEQSELDSVVRRLPEQLAQVGVPVILTLRSEDQGGHAAVDVETRRRFWTSVKKLPENCLIDVELDLIEELETPDGGLPTNWTRVICSHHDFTGLPADLEQIYQRMAETPARILKIAIQAGDATDCLPIFDLLDRAQNEGRELIGIAMGQAGVATRILGPSRGSYLAYGSFDEETATAPGQLTAEELRDLYRIDQIDRQTQIFGLLGRPVGHSISPHIHNGAFRAASMNAVYIPFEVGDAGQFLRRMVRPESRELDWNLRGLSVTTPHKTTVMNLLDWIDPTAREIGAVNTIVVRGDELHGYNTDAAGFIAPLGRLLGSLYGARCAVIGAGGGGRAAMWALREKGAHVVLFARNPDQASPVAQAFGVECRPLGTDRFDGFDIVINATPLGTRGELERDTPATADQLRGVRLAYDLVYNPTITRFLDEARTAGCEMFGGTAMLVAQAVEQFKLWTGKDPDVEVMRDAALRGPGL